MTKAKKKRFKRCGRFSRNGGFTI